MPMWLFICFACSFYSFSLLLTAAIVLWIKAFLERNQSENPAIIAGIIGLSGAVASGLGAWWAWKRQMKSRTLAHKGWSPEEMMRSKAVEMNESLRGSGKIPRGSQKKSILPTRT